MPQAQGISSTTSDSVIPFGDGTFFLFLFLLSPQLFPEKEEGERVYFQNPSYSFFILYSLPSPPKIPWIALYVTSIKKKKKKAAPLKPSKSN